MDSEILIARIRDTADICERNNVPKFLGFLSEEECVLAERTLCNSKQKFKLFGGYETAKRKILGFLPFWTDDMDFPITALLFSYRKEDVLRHRDFLGSLMALGLKRETIGDILIEEGKAVIFVLNDIADYIINEISKIGRTGVTVSKGYDGELPQSDTLTEFTVSVASERLDCVVSAIAGISRNAATEKITYGLVSVNSQITEKTTKSVVSGDVISVRGKGKFIIDSITDITKKNRIILRYKKYV